MSRAHLPHMNHEPWTMNHEVILVKEVRILNLISLWNRLQIIWVVFH